MFIPVNPLEMLVVSQPHTNQITVLHLNVGSILKLLCPLSNLFIIYNYI